MSADRLQVDHLARSDLETVHDPAQAWNAITVGAHTDKAVIQDPQFEAWSPVACPGELSPWSTTSVTFQDLWPIKPDVVLEGGNLAHNGNEIVPVPDLCFLSTYYQPSVRLLELSYATSAATAQVARTGAIIQAEYSGFWPEPCVR